MRLRGTERAKELASKRLQAQRDAMVRVNKVLVGSIEKMNSAYSAYNLNNGVPVLSSRYPSLSKSIRPVLKESKESIKDIVLAYALAEADFLDPVDRDEFDNGLRSYIEDVHFDNTFDKRNDVYVNRFAKEVEYMIGAGVVLGLSSSEIYNRMRNDYTNPYRIGGMINDANKTGKYTFKQKHYGVGKSNIAYNMISLNTTSMIDLAWCFGEFMDADTKGAKGYYVFRGSSYPCSYCDDEVGFLHSMDENVLPIHNRCCCYRVFVY